MSADPTQNLSESEALSTAQVAELTGLTQSYVRRLARDGAIPGSPVRGEHRTTWTYDRSQIQQWNAERNPQVEAAATSEAAWMNDLLLSENADLRRRELERSLELAETENAKLRNHIRILKRTVNDLMSAAVDDPEVDHLG